MVVTEGQVVFKAEGLVLAVVGLVVHEDFRRFYFVLPFVDGEFILSQGIPAGRFTFHVAAEDVLRTADDDGVSHVQRLDCQIGAIVPTACDGEDLMPGFSEGVGETIAHAPACRYSSAENYANLHK